MAEQFFETGDGRLFLQKFGPRPDRAYEYWGCARLEGLTEPRGDKTPYYCPDPAVRGRFVQAGAIRGQPGLPTSSIVARMSNLIRARRLTCPFDLQVLFGKCKDPQDRIRGWQKILHLYRADITEVSTDGMSALEPGDAKPILVTSPITMDALFEIDPLTFSAAAGTDVTTQVVDVAVCDAVSCGECEDVSEGCEKIYLLCQAPGAGSPAILPELVYTEDGGATWLNEYIDTLGAAEQPSAIACVGPYLLVVSGDVASLHYAEKAAPGTWTEVATGFVAGGAPLAISVVDASHVFIVGKGGYIYRATDIAAGVDVLNAGVATSQNLRAVHALNSQIIVAAGDNNAVVYSDDGGDTWVAVTGPNPGVNLLSCWAQTEDRWLVGTDNIGTIYYTLDRGQTWRTCLEIGAAADIRDIVFSEDPAVGYAAVAMATPAGRIYRTIDGGRSWYRLPEQTGVNLPASDTINALAVCGVNEVWAGGLADDGADGVVLHGVGYE